MIVELNTIQNNLLCIIQIQEYYQQDCLGITVRIDINNYSYYLLKHKEKQSKIITIFEGLNNLAEIIFSDENKSYSTEKEICEEVLTFIKTISEELELLYNIRENTFDESSILF